MTLDKLNWTVNPKDFHIIKQMYGMILLGGNWQEFHPHSNKSNRCTLSYRGSFVDQWLNFNFDKCQNTLTVNEVSEEGLLRMRVALALCVLCPYHRTFFEANDSIFKERRNKEEYLLLYYLYDRNGNRFHLLSLLRSRRVASPSLDTEREQSPQSPWCPRPSSPAQYWVSSNNSREFKITALLNCWVTLFSPFSRFSLLIFVCLCVFIYLFNTIRVIGHD